MQIRVLHGEFTVCKVKSLEEVDFSDPFCFIGKTDEECSLVCSTGRVPKEAVKREDGFRMFRIEGELDFSLVGILSEIGRILAGAGIAIFALSTYNTDYILTKKEQFPKALELLQGNGYRILN